MQLNYPAGMEPGFPGMKLDLTDDYVRSHHNAEASAEIPFGVAVAQGTHPEAAILPTSAGARIIGITLHSHVYARPEEVGDVGVKPKVTLNVLSRGTCWVRTESAVVVGARPFVRFAAGAGGTQLGAFRGDADTATAVELTGGRFLNSASAGGLVQVEFDANVRRALV